VEEAVDLLISKCRISYERLRAQVCTQHISLYIVFYLSQYIYHSKPISMHQNLNPPNRPPPNQMLLLFILCLDYQLVQYRCLVRGAIAEASIRWTYSFVVVVVVFVVFVVLFVVVFVFLAFVPGIVIDSGFVINAGFGTENGLEFLFSQPLS